MPGIAIGSGRIGGPGVVASPNRAIGSSLPFRSRMGVHNLTLFGTTEDKNGAVLSGCRVMVFRTADNVFVAETVSDENGFWQVFISGGPYFLVDYQVGTPDLAGTSVNTLMPL